MKIGYDAGKPESRRAACVSAETAPGDARQRVSTVLSREGMMDERDLTPAILSAWRTLRNCRCVAGKTWSSWRHRTALRGLL